jgi:hypothetical protein
MNFMTKLVFSGELSPELRNKANRLWSIQTMEPQKFNQWCICWHRFSEPDEFWFRYNTDFGISNELASDDLAADIQNCCRESSD